MAVSCSEVMYGAYYPYLYGRGAARSFHHAPHFQYDRFNVQSGAGNVGGGDSYGLGVGVVGRAVAGLAAARAPRAPRAAAARQGGGAVRARPHQRRRGRLLGVGGRVRGRGGRRGGPCARAVRVRQLRGVHPLLGRRGRSRRRALREGALHRQTQRERADGVAQPAGVVLRRGGGGGGRGGRRGRRGRRVRGRRRPVRVRPVAPALRRVRARGAPARGRVPRGRRGHRAPQHGRGGRLRRAAARPRLAAPPVQAGRVARAAPRRARARAPPRRGRLLALLLPAGAARSGGAGAGHVEGPLLVLRPAAAAAEGRRLAPAASARLVLNVDRRASLCSSAKDARTSGRPTRTLLMYYTKCLIFILYNSFVCSAAD